MTTPARKTQYQVPHEISATITYATPAIATGVQVGTLPAGAIIDSTSVFTTTAWNGTVSVALSVGITGTGTGLISATDVRTAAARVDTVTPIANVGPLAADTPIYASVALGGTAGSAGSSTVVVYYIPGVG
jgi:hypothetical protein